MSGIDSESMWRYNQESNIKELKESLVSIQSDLIKAMNTEGPDDSKSNEITVLQQEVLSLRNLISELSSTGFGAKINNDTNNISANPRLEKINKFKITLSDDKGVSGIKNKEDTIPAGSFAKAVILGGVDASTALSASSDPRPLLIRLVDPGNLPRKFKSDLQDCHIVASGYGDLSSERVFARLEKLTCVERGSGEIVETEVAGYISGEDGRAGIRGVVEEKGRGYLAKSIIGGVLQGLTGILSPERNVTLNPMGAYMPKRDAQDRFNEGLLSGGASSMERLSKYYIDRAESIQPVIQIASGRVVDVIFTEGADIGTSRVKEKLKIKRQSTANKSNELELEEKDGW